MLRTIFCYQKNCINSSECFENPKYSQFISGYNINDQNITLQRETIGNVDNQIEPKLPTEQEIQEAQEFNKYIPQYTMKENGEIINMNQNSLESLMKIKEENTQNQVGNNFIQQNRNPTNEINTNSNDINQPLIIGTNIELLNKE